MMNSFKKTGLIIASIAFATSAVAQKSEQVKW
jgi:hypothetical protein